MIAKAELWTQQLLEIEDLDGNLYETMILKIEQDTLSIRQPVNKENIPITVSSGSEVIVFCYPEGKDKYYYQSQLIQDGTRFYISQPEDGLLTKVQRRNFFRVPATVEFWYETEAKNARFDRITSDISGGGLAFFSLPSEPVAVGDRISGMLKIDSKEVPFQADIVHIRPVYNEYARSCYSLSFVDMRESQRDIIIGYCMKRQVEIRKKIGDTK
ncbi:PilZ domain-containing protein [Paenibacillus sp. N1-5-1-14]|uniref:flagellar brake protein n=1 Tax=Paenibacillus radicibacter TaxID=2972488 RepID=UPI002159A76B|nr:PilZ domain-containing protein [Paenibacillus radicibacter]MCR8642983.1 PilZ domain-containing protein [Paenibacillus radicibacter]